MPVVVRIVEEDFDDVDTEISMLCDPDATTKDGKQILWKNASLSRHYSNHDVEFRLTDANHKPVYLNFEKNRQPLDATRLNLRVVPLDPCVKGLFQLVGMGEADRDAMMERMTVKRAPRNCPGNHSLLARPAGCFRWPQQQCDDVRKVCLVCVSGPRLRDVQLCSLCPLPSK